MKFLRRVPWWVWLFVIPALLLALNDLRKGGRARVEIAGAGLIDVVREEDAPPGLRYYTYTTRHAPLDEAAKRIEARLRLQPGLIMFGLDADALRTSTSTEAKRLLANLTRKGLNAAQVVVVVGFAAAPDAPDVVRERVAELSSWWRSDVCRQTQRLACLDLAPHAADPNAVREAVAAAALDGQQRLRDFRATTQGRP